MAKPVFSFKDTTVNDRKVKIVTFEIPGGVCTPKEFSEAIEQISDRFAGDFGVILNGRGPIWGFGMAIHQAHPCQWVATRDPRLGAVVVASHVSGISVGDIIPFAEKEG